MFPVNKQINGILILQPFQFTFNHSSYKCYKTEILSFLLVPERLFKLGVSVIIIHGSVNKRNKFFSAFRIILKTFSVFLLKVLIEFWDIIKNKKTEKKNGYGN